MSTPTFELNSLNGNNGFIINGIDADDRSGYSVGSAGDLNGDGIDDLILGASFASPNGDSRAGESYVIFGSTSGFNPALELSSLNGSNGFVINGIDSGDRSGYSVSRAGDVNGDGIDDIIVGAFRASPNGNDRAGESYVIFGNSNGFNASVELSSLNGGNGFVINGVDRGDRSGYSVSDAGDVNGDGIDDIIIGAYSANPGGRSEAGASYVVFGSTSGFASSIDLSSLNGSNGFALAGIDADDRSGRYVSSAGDVNGDGIDDVMIGAYNASPGGRSGAGETYVVFGSTNGFAPLIELSSLNGSNGFTLAGIDAGDRSGRYVSNAGDVNADGIDDIIIGADSASPGGRSAAGESYVVFGSTSGFAPTIELSSLNGSNGFTLNGVARNDRSGSSVGGAGDVNGDGTDDIIIGAVEADPNGNSRAGESYVVYGRSNGFDPSIELSSLDGNNGFVLKGVDGGDRSGSSVGITGDINQDGLDDLIIGSIAASPNGNSSGESYVVFGFENALTLRGGTAQIAYVAYYGRPADNGGQNFWNQVLTDNDIRYSPRNGDVLTGEEEDVYNQFVNDFGTSDEANRIFGGLSNRDKVNTVYNFAFNRDGDAGGLDFWTQQLDSGSVNLTTFAMEVALGAQNEDVTTLSNKIDSADLFSRSLDTPAEIQAYTGQAGEEFGRSWLEPFGADVATQMQVDSALADLVG